MSVVIQGADALHRRLTALLSVPKRVEHDWAEETVPIMRGYIPRRTGATAGSLRASDQGILGSPVVNFLDAGTRAHDITGSGILKFQTGGGTVFRKKVHKPETRGLNFVGRAAREGLDHTGTDAVVQTWNGAA